MCFDSAMSMISLILHSLIAVKIKRRIKFILKSAALTFVRLDTDNLLSAGDYTNFAFNFAFTVTCKLKKILLMFL